MNPERVYTVLREPHISEKVSNLGDASNQYAFKVARDATKAEIKEAVETLFGVNVVGVTTLNVKGKFKRSSRGTSRKRGWKKAYIRIASGQEIDYMVTE
ncbi:MAG: 50S ribosomal protein L23 [Gammaproteobacteria bacterium]|nr:50S ribosomal protein L23 [Gammaproteobacteria bacterium]